MDQQPYSPVLATPRFAGTMAAVPTPCRAFGGPVDTASMRRYCQTLAARGCDGLLVLGSTGEAVLLNEDDRRSLTCAAREGLPTDTALLVGISGTGLKQTLRYAHLAASDGADVAVVMAPFFQRLDQRQLAAYVRAISDESPIPVGLYHHLRMSTPFEIDTVAALAAHPNIVLYKDTSTDLDRMRQLIAATRGTGLRLLQGSETLILSSLEAGADGCVSALASIAPEWHAGLDGAFRDGRYEAAAEFQRHIADLVTLFRLPQVRQSLAHFVHTLKFAALQRGWIASAASLLAGFEPDAEFEQAIGEILESTGLLKTPAAPRAL